jgi:hypothetical protein
VPLQRTDAGGAEAHALDDRHPTNLSGRAGSPYPPLDCVAPSLSRRPRFHWKGYPSL